MELHYVAIRDYAITSDTLSLADILSSRTWRTEEFTLTLSLSNADSERHYYRAEDGKVVYGKWHLHDISKNKLLVLQKNPGENHLYQIQSIANDQLDLIDLRTHRKIRLTPSS